MSLENTVMKQAFVGTGSQVDFPFTFPVISDDSEEIKVYLSTIADPTDEALQTEGVDYTLTGANPPGTPFHNNVRFTNAPSNLQRVVIKRVIPLKQELDLDTGSNVNLSGNEQQLDKIVGMIQELNEQLTRIPKLRNSSQSSAPLLPEPVEDNILQWSSGNLENTPLPITVTDAALATQLEAEGGVENTAYMSSLRTAQQLAARLASQAEAEAGTNNVQLITPLRARQGFDTFIKSPASAGFLHNLAVTATANSNNLVIIIQQGDGTTAPSSTNPASVAVHRSGNAVGGYDVLDITSALTLVVPAGATLGQLSGDADSLYVYLIDNSGTLELAVSSGILNTNDTYGQIDTTTISTSADDGQVIYSETGRSNIQARLIGKVRAAHTSGNWTTVQNVETWPMFDRNVHRIIEDNDAPASAWAFGDGVWGDLTSIQLPIGTWIIDAQLLCITTANSSVPEVRLGISETSGNSSTGLVNGENLMILVNGPASANTQLPLTIVGYLVTVTGASDNTYYLKGRTNDQSQLQLSGYRIRAHRVNKRADL